MLPKCIIRRKTVKWPPESCFPSLARRGGGDAYVSGAELRAGDSRSDARRASELVSTGGRESAPGRNRTCFLSVRSRTLCPVSYRREKPSPV